MIKRPTLYFRRKDNGATVYRITSGDHSRLDMQQIAVLKQNGEVKSQGKQQPTETELAEITAWHEVSKAEQKARDAARIDQLIIDMNATAQWIQANATDKQISQTAEPILMAMHDLRSTLVRRMAGRDK